MSGSKDKIKFLSAIRRLRDAYETILLPKNLTRTISFRIFPKGEDRKILNKWFEEISEIKYLHLKDLYDEFKEGKLNLFSNKKLDYAIIYKGKKRFEKFKPKKNKKSEIIESDKEINNTYKIITSKVEEGIRMDILSIFNGFLTNTQKAFSYNKKKIENLIKNVVESEEKLIQNLIESYKNLDIKDYKSWQTAKDLTEKINQIIAQINIERNLKKRKSLPKLKRLPAFPLVEKYKDLVEFKKRSNLKFNIEDFREKIKKLLADFKNKFYLGRERNIKEKEGVISEYLQKRAEQFLEKLKYRKRKSKLWKDRFLDWYQNSGKNKSIEDVIETLFKKLEKQENHLLKKPFDIQGRNKFFNTLFFITELLYVSNLPEEEKQNALNEINNEITKIKAEFLKGKPIKDSFIISGFSWSSNNKTPKPQKLGTLILKKEKDENKEKIKLGIAIGVSNEVFCLKKDHDKDFYFIVLSGGSKKISQRKPKEVQFLEGHLEKKDQYYSCYFWLHHGKSYLRRILFHKDWGFLSKSLVESENKFSPTNARFKRVKRKPGDEFEYYVDISFRYEGDTSNMDKETLENKIKYILGIDRGEKYPMAYALLDKETEEIVDKGILGEEFSEKLEELHKKRKRRKMGNKILRTQETILHQSISKILQILSKYPAIIVMEKLKIGFGKEKKIIAKRVYRKIEKFLGLSLQYANLPKKYLIKFVNPKDTSIICPYYKCNFNFNEEIKRKFLDNLDKAKDRVERFKNLITERKINFEDKKISINNLKINLPYSWEIYSDKGPKNIKLDKIKELIEQNKFEEALENFKTITPRITRDKFKCLKCGYEEESDIVGAINIAKRYLEEKPIHKSNK